MRHSHRNANDGRDSEFGHRQFRRLKDPLRGTIHHMEIHPAQNSAGGKAFITSLHRNPPEAAQQAMDAGGAYAWPPEPEQVPHEDGQDMLQHVGNTFGVKPAQDDEAEPEEPTGDD